MAAGAALPTTRESASNQILRGPKSLKYLILLLYNLRDFNYRVWHRVNGLQNGWFRWKKLYLAKTWGLWVVLCGFQFDPNLQVTVVWL